MRHRSLTTLCAGALAALALSVSPVLLSAQTPAAKPGPAQPATAKPAASPAAAKPYTPPRTKDGHPDLSGMYDVATMTPLERPAEAGGRLVLTKEEAGAIEQYEYQRQGKKSAPPARAPARPPGG